MCLQGFMKFQPRGFKILRKQSFTDERRPGRTDNVKTVYPPYNFVIAGGIITQQAFKRQTARTSFTYNFLDSEMQVANVIFLRMFAANI